MSNFDEILTVKELAAYLKLAESTVYKLAQDGEIPGRKIGGNWRFSRDQINKWMAGGDDVPFFLNNPTSPPDESSL